ncbi:MAG: MBL fold metallo-hydrolase [Chloroflexi bacterium]|nr:MBL fold metallo-hydrolase [Chloroflexota bacterium]
MALYAFELGPMPNNTYVVVDDATKSTAIVDPSFDSDRVLDWVDQQSLKIEYLLLTHAHFDHIVGNALVKQRTGAKLVMHPDDVWLLERGPEKARSFGLDLEPSPEPDEHFVEGEPFRLGELELQVFHTPGHSPGSVSLYTPGYVLVGDVLFQGSVGRTDLEGASPRQLVTSIKTKLFTLPDETVVYSGHGPATTIGRERRHNPFVGEQAGGVVWME